MRGCVLDIWCNMAMPQPRTDPDKVLALIKQLDVLPFQEMLADYMDCFPSKDAIRAAAEKYPDRFIQGMVMLTKMAGYRPDTPITQNNMFVVIQGMSDSELRQLNQKLDVERKQLMERTVDGEVEDGTHA